ncbi:FAD-dependent oxidoreductase [Variovorax defluvii]|uniref:FAD-dependent oxidoreductase n=1 Tax=Variovorax defluvii TaxID=913761 RepID=A0ABP8IA41_9BURK
MQIESPGGPDTVPGSRHVMAHGIAGARARSPSAKPSVRRPAAAREVDFLLLGGGLASATAAEALRQEGAEGSIVIVSAEQRLPYHRPPLSKRILVADTVREPPPVLRQADYLRMRIDLLLGTRALSVDAKAHRVSTDAGLLRYRKLLIATGASPVRLQVPGAALQGVHHLRSIEDAWSLQAAARKGSRAVVIGASFIGMEVSASLVQRGVQVTLLISREGIFPTLHAPEASRFFEAQHARHGVDMVAGEVLALEGEGRVEGVRTSDGRLLPCDFVVVGIGVAPEIDFLAHSGIQTGSGVLVDQRLRSSDPDVFAAGDVAAFLDRALHTRRRVEHWDNAIKQGRLAARNMLGQELPYDDVSTFFCDVFETSFQFLGTPDDATQRRELGSPDSGAWALLYLKGQVPRALFTTGRPAQETSAIRALIRYRTHIGRIGGARWNRPGFSITDIPSQTVLILQGGGALGAFECGAVQALEQRGIRPDIVAGVSIGAFNGAIVASHPGHAGEALASFWHELAMSTPELPQEQARRLLSSTIAMMWGVPAFLRPRWQMPGSLFTDPASLTSCYDTAPMRALLARYVDFAALRDSPVRLLASAVDVETAELRIFDSYVDDITVDHLLASGSLPPGMPWTEVGGRHYWDGGIVSNSPLDLVAERCGVAGKRIFIIDLFSPERPLPRNMMEVLTRRDEIGFAERIRRTSAEQAMVGDFRKLVDDVVQLLDPATAAQVRQRPNYVELMGAASGLDIVRIVRDATAGEPASRDFDFSLRSIEEHILAGHARTLLALEASRRSPRR